MADVRVPRNPVVPGEVKIPIMVNDSNAVNVDRYARLKHEELDYSRIKRHVDAAEAKLQQLGVPADRRVGAMYDYHPAAEPKDARMETMYKGGAHVAYQAPVPTFKLQRLEEGWHLADIGTKKVDLGVLSHQDLWLTPAQQEIVRANQEKGFALPVRDPAAEHAPRGAKETRLPVKAIKQYEKALEDIGVPESQRKGAQAVAYDGRNRQYVLLQRFSSEYHQDDPAAKSNWKIVSSVAPGSVAEKMVKDKQVGMILTKTQRDNILHDRLKKERVYSQPGMTLSKAKGMSL